jgi:hypothetical protein
MYEARDLAPGRQVVEIFRPFLRHLLGLKLSGKTLRKHRDNLWLLGGEIISGLHKNPRRRKWPMEQVVRSSPTACRKTSNARLIRRVGSCTASSRTVRAAAEGLWTCGQRKRVAHMPTATTTDTKGFKEVT